MAVELVEDNIRLGVALDLDDDAQPFAIAFVAQLGNAFDHLFPYGLGDALDQLCLVDLIGNLGEDERFAVLADLLDMALGP